MAARFSLIPLKPDAAEHDVIFQLFNILHKERKKERKKYHQHFTKTQRVLSSIVFYFSPSFINEGITQKHRAKGSVKPEVQRIFSQLSPNPTQSVECSQHDFSAFVLDGK
jgi:hypothetical protein